MRQRRQMNQINVVPYIDVMLVLLVIFMVTAPMIQTGSIDLPSVAKATPPPVAPLEVVIRADATLALRDRSKGGASAVELTQADLVARLKEAQERNPQQAILIAGDKNVRYEAVLKVMDELQKNQVTKIGLLVQPGASDTSASSASSAAGRRAR
ncbi:MAG: protein TolR [Sterolibacterium sp.]|nr:protein TolR [Sterolibacterium sp.]